MEEKPVKLSTATLESEMIVNSVQERRSATIKPEIIARISAMLASRALAERTKEECQDPVGEKQTTPIEQRLEVGMKEAST